MDMRGIEMLLAPNNSFLFIDPVIPKNTVKQNKKDSIKNACQYCFRLFFIFKNSLSKNFI